MMTSLTTQPSGLVYLWLHGHDTYKWKSQENKGNKYTSYENIQYLVSLEIVWA